MKKLFFMVCCAALLMTGCKDGKNAPGLASVQQTDSLNDVIAQKDSEINEMMGTLNDIEEGFRLINEAENRVALLKNGEGTSKKQNLKENIQFIAERMKQNRELIAKLQKQLESSTLKGGQLKKTIDNLTAQLEEKDKQLLALREELDKKDIHISELDETIGNLNTNVSNLSADNQQKAETINAQDKQLNTAWYVLVPRRNLRVSISWKVAR